MEQKRLNLRVDVKAIRRLMRQVKEPEAFRLSLEEIQKKLEEAVDDWRKHKKHQLELRKNYELRIDRKRAQMLGTSVEAQTKHRHNTTTTKSIFKKIKMVMKPFERTAISTVEYTTEEGHTIECLHQTDIEEACVAEGQRRFTQAETTPFLQGSLLAAFGYNANATATDQVMAGTFVPDDDVSEYTSAFIQELRMPECIKTLPPIHGTCTTEAHTTGWKRMKARTGSSPYGPLICDYIAGTQHPEVAEIDASLSSIPYLAGFSPLQWQEATDVMIPKKKSSRHVEKLRIIVLIPTAPTVITHVSARTPAIAITDSHATTDS